MVSLSRSPWKLLNFRVDFVRVYSKRCERTPIFLFLKEFLLLLLSLMLLLLSMLPADALDFVDQVP